MAKQRATVPIRPPGSDAERAEHADEAARAYLRYGPIVYRRCLQVLGDRPAAALATRDVFEEVLRGLRRLDDHELLVAWLYRLADRHCRALLRGDGKDR